jgi:hypothetical protein
MTLYRIATDKKSNYTSRSTHPFSSLHLTAFASISNAICAMSHTRNGNALLKTGSICGVNAAKARGQDSLQGPDIAPSLLPSGPPYAESKCTLFWLN